MSWYYMTLEQAAKNEKIRPLTAQMEANNSEIARLENEIHVFEQNLVNYPLQYAEIMQQIAKDRARIAQLQSNTLDLANQVNIVKQTTQTNNPAAREDLPYESSLRPRLLEQTAVKLGFHPDDMFSLASVFMALKEPKMFRDIIVKWLDTQGRMVQALAQSQHNPISSYANSFLIALLLEQQYFIRQRGADDLIGSLNWVWGANALSNAVSTLFSGGSQFPSTIVYAASELRETVETMKAKAISTKPQLKNSVIPKE